MKTIVGALIIILGIFAGAYVGVWLCFIGGIVQVIEQVRAETLEPLQVAIGVAKVLFTKLVFWITVWGAGAVGSAMINNR